MDEANDQRQQRIKKLEELRSLGVNPFGTHFEVTDRAGQLIQLHGKKTKEELERAGLRCRIAGRIVALRRFGKAAFALLQDGADRVQVYLKKDTLGEHAYRICVALDVGDWIGVSGLLFRTKTDEFTVDARELNFLSKALRSLPEKWHGLTDVETRYRQRYADLVVNDDVRAVFRSRAAIVGALREFLDARGYVEVETPVLQPLYGGAAARPFVTHHNALDMKLYLRIAVELYLKRLIVGGLDRVYEVAKTFRNEGVDRFHNPEFTMLELYQAYADYEDMMTLAQELILHSVRKVHGSLRIPFDGREIDFTPPWRRVVFRDAAAQALGMEKLPAQEPELRELARRAGIAIDPAFSYGRILDEVVSAKVQPDLVAPTFLVDHPRDISPLAKAKRGDPTVVERFEVVVAGMEVANAFSEQNDPAEQRRAFEAQLELRKRGDDEAQLLDADYLRALELGLPP